ncbi:TPA: hypothetical protein U2Q23_002691 [Burkholderia multivorans]|nr:hypothetical protein [Burkholderia multivorans]HEM7840263.1 hypothetical protein [Burkholderia multivorans]HEM7870537.1 hypothetical protein [Burkholderia multivorans]HEM7906039.1 hypothetical protein [Burkholderia multivorans]HEM8536574.1 hypothetical protein [Burkholderia multivorans]
MMSDFKSTERISHLDGAGKRFDKLSISVSGNAMSLNHKHARYAADLAQFAQERFESVAARNPALLPSLQPDEWRAQVHAMKREVGPLISRGPAALAKGLAAGRPLQQLARCAAACWVGRDAHSLLRALVVYGGPLLTGADWQSATLLANDVLDEVFATLPDRDWPFVDLPCPIPGLVER